MPLKVYNTGALWSDRDPQSWQMRFVDYVVRFLGWLTGQTLELTARAAAPYPQTVAEELDILAALRQKLLRAQHKPGAMISVEMKQTRVRPGTGSLLHDRPESINLPKNLPVPWEPGNEGIFPRRSDASNGYDFRHCAATMQVWKAIKERMPLDGCVVVSIASPNGYDTLVLGRYIIFRGRLEYHPNRLQVYIKSQ